MNKEQKINLCLYDLIKGDAIQMEKNLQECAKRGCSKCQERLSVRSNLLNKKIDLKKESK